MGTRKSQPRIVLDLARRGTRGWEGPGAYEWDDSTPPTSGGEDKPVPGRGYRLSGRTVILRPKGITVRDPSRKSACFSPESRGFIAPSQTNVRDFAAAPVSDGIVPSSQEEEGGGQDLLHHKQAKGVNGCRKRPRRVSRRGDGGVRRYWCRLSLASLASDFFSPLKRGWL